MLRRWNLRPSFDKLSPNGLFKPRTAAPLRSNGLFKPRTAAPPRPFGLSLSKVGQSFDKLSPNGWEKAAVFLTGF